VIAAVVFDLDGVVVDSEQVWDDVRERLVRERGGRWHDRAQADMMGMSSLEWSRYMHERLGLAQPPEEINAEVVRRLLERYDRELPLVDGAGEAVRRLGAEFPLAVASSSNRPVIEAVLSRAGIADLFAATPPSERAPLSTAIRDVAHDARNAGSISGLARDDFPVRGLPYRDLDPETLPDLAAIAAERLRALNWLCGFGPTWDEVPLDL
jgi:hypothetical protein